MRLEDGMNALKTLGTLNMPQPDTLQEKLNRLGQAVYETKTSLDRMEEKLFGLAQCGDGDSTEPPYDIESIILSITELAEKAKRTAYNIKEKL